MTTARTTINQCLHQLAARLGAPRLALNEAGVCAFAYQGQFEVVIEVPEDSSLVYFYAPIMPLPERDAAELAGFYEQLLKLNAFSALTRGATIALDPEQPRILLCYHYPADFLDDAQFHNIVTHFVLALGDLRDRLASDSGPDLIEPALNPAADPVNLFLNRV